MFKVYDSNLNEKKSINQIFIKLFIEILHNYHKIETFISKSFAFNPIYLILL